MRGLIVGLILGLSIPLGAGELTEPPPLSPELREVFLYFKELKRESNNHSVVTDNPDGSRPGLLGDIVIYNNSGSFKTCVAIDNVNNWECSANAFTAP